MKGANSVKINMILTLVLFCLFAACPAYVFAEPVQIPEKSEEYVKGSTLSNQGKKDEARALYEAGAEKGDAWCIYSLGVFYNEGLGGLKKDEARAFVMIQRAADLNLPVAYRYLADAYFEGSRLAGKTQDERKGVKYLTIAAGLNDVKACADLGKIYLWGKGNIRRDPTKSAEYFTKAADLNDAESAGFLGRAYVFGNDGLRKDEEKGVEMLEKAAELNNPDGLRDLGYLYSYGLCGVSKDAKKGKELTKKAAALKKPDLNVTADTIIQDVESNAVTASMKYEGKIVRMRGLVWHVGKTDDQAYATISTSWHNHQSLVCYFEKGRIYEAVPLKTGFNATIQGRIGKVDGDSVALYDCWVIPTN